MHELIDRLAATPKTLAHLVVEADARLLDAAPVGGWSARTILAHMRDDEYLCMRCALERMLAEEGPQLRFIDGSDWEPGRNRTRDRKEQILGDFALQRQATIGILRAMRPGDWRRRKAGVRSRLPTWRGRGCGTMPSTSRSLKRRWANRSAM